MVLTSHGGGAFGDDPAGKEVGVGKRFWCWRCERRTLFPSVHYALHFIDLLRSKR